MPFIGTYTLLVHQRRAVRREVKMHLANRLRRDELTPMKFQQNSAAHKQLKWKRADEFELDGAMYDIVSSEVKGDTIVYLCWPDIKETNLNNDFKNMLADALGTNPFRKEHRNRLVQFIKKNYQAPSHYEGLAIHVHYGSAVFGYAENYISLNSSPPVPPPPNFYLG